MLRSAVKRNRNQIECLQRKRWISGGLKPVEHLMSVVFQVGLVLGTDSLLPSRTLLRVLRALQPLSGGLNSGLRALNRNLNLLLSSCWPRREACCRRLRKRGRPSATRCRRAPSRHGANQAPPPCPSRASVRRDTSRAAALSSCSHSLSWDCRGCCKKKKKQPTSRYNIKIHEYVALLRSECTCRLNSAMRRCRVLILSSNLVWMWEPTDWISS